MLLEVIKEEKMAKKKKPQFTLKADKPLGESLMGKGFGDCDWNNQSLGTDGPVTCEICGTDFPERLDQSYTISRFLGKQVIEECCGVVLDQVYHESGEQFTVAFLKEFAQDPTNPRFHMMIVYLKDALKNALESTVKTASNIAIAQENLEKIPS